MKTFFISYVWQDKSDPERVLHFANVIIDKHPVEWAVEKNARGDRIYVLLQYQGVFDKLRDKLTVETL